MHMIEGVNLHLINQFLHSQRETMRTLAGACGGLLVVAGVQYVAARILAELAVPQDVQTGESYPSRDPRHGQ